MARGKGLGGLHRTLPAGRIASGMKETVDGVKGFERYQREFGTRGIVKWEAFQEINMYFFAGISSRGDLSPEQKAIAVKEFMRRAWGEMRGVENYLISVMDESIRFARELVPVPIPRPR